MALGTVGHKMWKISFWWNFFLVVQVIRNCNIHHDNSNIDINELSVNIIKMKSCFCAKQKSFENRNKQISWKLKVEIFWCPRLFVFQLFFLGWDIFEKREFEFPAVICFQAQLKIKQKNENILAPIHSFVFLFR